MKSLSVVLKEIRENKGLTLKELSQKSGVGPSTISDIENGKAQNPRIETLVNLSKALEIEPKVLLNVFWGNPPNESETQKNNIIDDDVRAIARDMKKLSTKNKNLLKQLIESMKEAGDDD
ncbi:MAG: helix-turn-helix domain-containing protein [Filifactoraceae bacterium]